MKHLPWREVGWAVAFVVVLLGLYAGSYYALLEPTVEGPAYWGVHQGPVVKLFAPMHQIDRAVRSGYWSRVDSRL